MKTRAVSLAVMMILAGSAAAHADGDAVAGKTVFNKCRACHDATGDKNKVGPNLATVMGRTAGTLESFGRKYSKAMIAAGEGGLVWDEATLALYLAAPKAKVPGTNMAFAGLKKDDEIANVIAYLKADPKP